jgi:hypothetical protein
VRKNKWHITLSQKPDFVIEWQIRAVLCSGKKQMTSLGVLWQWFRFEIVIAYSLSYITTTQEVCGEFHEVKDINFASVRKHYQFTSQPSITGLDVISTDNRSTPAKRVWVIQCIVCQCTCRVNLLAPEFCFTLNSNKSPTWFNNFSVYYPDVCLQLNMFWAFFHPSSGARWLQWQLLVLPSYRGDSRAVFVVGPAGRPDHEHSTTITTIRR